MLPATFVPGFHDEAAVRAMPYSRLGRTGLMVSRLGLGGAAFSAIYENSPEEEWVQLIRKALRLGVNYIDTAPWYGQGRSEEVLGKALKGVPREAYYIGTKVCRYDLDPRTMFDFTAGRVTKSIDESLKRLGLDFVDLLQVHDVEFAPSLDMVLNETLPAVKRAVKEGKARFVGVTGYPPAPLKEIILKDSGVDAVLSYSRDTILDQTFREYVAFFQERDVGMITASATMMGLLTNAGPQPWHPAPQSIKDVCKRAAEYCKSVGVELADLAVHYAFSLDGPATHLLSLGSEKLLNNTLRVLREGLTDKEKATLQYIKDRLFSDLKVAHWEGVELEQRRQALAKYKETA